MWFVTKFITVISDRIDSSGGRSPPRLFSSGVSRRGVDSGKKKKQVGGQYGQRNGHKKRRRV